MLNPLGHATICMAPNVGLTHPLGQLPGSFHGPLVMPCPGTRNTSFLPHQQAPQKLVSLVIQQRLQETSPHSNRQNFVLTHQHLDVSVTFDWPSTWPCVSLASARVWWCYVAHAQLTRQVANITLLAPEENILFSLIIYWAFSYEQASLPGLQELIAISYCNVQPSILAACLPLEGQV